MAELAKPKNENASKVLYGMLAILAVIGGMSAIVLPMQQSIDGLRMVLAEHRSAKGHSPTTAVLAAVKQDFKEVETQFRAQRDLLDRTDAKVGEQAKILRELEGLLLRTHERLQSNIEQMSVTDSWIREHDLRIPGTDSAQWERIRALERQVYGSPQDAASEKGH